jgi:16S rRNA (guanine1207-N2)-methyltransferase
MVANRHLPYEESLRARFGFVEELEGGNSRFKILHAAKPSRKR